MPTTYMLDPRIPATGISHYRLMTPETTGETTVRTHVTGWTLGTRAAGWASEMEAGVERNAGWTSPHTDLDTIPPNGVVIGDSWRVPAIFDGRFSAGAWTFMMNGVAVQGSSFGSVRMKYNLWRGSDPSGTNAIRFGGGLATAVTANNTAKFSPLTINIGEVSMPKFYLFLKVQVYISSKGGHANNDWRFRVSNSTADGSHLIVPDFIPTQQVPNSLEDAASWTVPSDRGGTPTPNSYSKTIYPASADLGAAHGATGVNVPSNIEIPAVTSIDSTLGSTSADALDIPTADEIIIDPVFDTELEVSYSARETRWQIGEFII